MTTDRDFRHLATQNELSILFGHSAQYISRIISKLSIERIPIDSKTKGVKPNDVRKLVLERGRSFQKSMILFHAFYRKSGTTTLVRQVADWAISMGHRVLIINACWDSYVELSYGINGSRREKSLNEQNFASNEPHILSIWNELNAFGLKFSQKEKIHELEELIGSLRNIYDIVLVDVPTHKSPLSDFLFDLSDQILIPINLCAEKPRLEEISELILRNECEKTSIVPIFALEITGNNRVDNKRLKYYGANRSKVMGKIKEISLGKLEIHNRVSFDRELAKANDHYVKNIGKASRFEDLSDTRQPVFKSEFMRIFAFKLLGFENLKEDDKHCDLAPKFSQCRKRA